MFLLAQCLTAAIQALVAQFLDDVAVGATLVRLIVLGVLEQNFVHVSAGILEQLVCAVEDDQGDLAVTEHTQLIGLLHQAKLALRKRHLPVPLVRDPGYLYFFPPHGFGFGTRCE